MSDVRMAFRENGYPNFRFEGEDLLWDVTNEGQDTAEPGDVVDLLDVYPNNGAPWRLEAPLNDKVEPGTAATNRVRIESSMPDGVYGVQLFLQGGAHGIEHQTQFAVRYGKPTFDADAFDYNVREAEATTGEEGVVMRFRDGRDPSFRMEGDQLCWDLVNEGNAVAEAGAVIDLLDVLPASGAGWRLEATLNERVEPGTAATNRVDLGSLPDDDYTLKLYVQNYEHQIEYEHQVRVTNGHVQLNAGMI
ncbi:MAG TPA: hypothetical protein VF855_00230 [Acidimicrobiales bacterium]